MLLIDQILLWQFFHSLLWHTQSSFSKTSFWVGFFQFFEIKQLLTSPSIIWKERKMYMKFFQTIKWKKSIWRSILLKIEWIILNNCSLKSIKEIQSKFLWQLESVLKFNHPWEYEACQLFFYNSISSTQKPVNNLEVGLIHARAQTLQF